MYCSKTSKWPLMFVAAVCTSVIVFTVSPANSQTKRTPAAQAAIPAAAAAAPEIPAFSCVQGREVRDGGGGRKS